MSDSTTPPASASEVIIAGVQTPPDASKLTSAKNHSYGQILKSSALIGGSSVVNIAFSIVRTKAMALFLGPSGVGLMGLFSSIADLSQNIAGMGINSSGVRQIAEAVGTGDNEKIKRTVGVLRRTGLILGILGALFLLLFAKQVSLATFGSTKEAAGIGVLSLAVLFRLLSDAQGAVIQGMRRIADLARLAVLAALMGTIASVVIIYFFRERGIVPSLVTVTGASFVISWWFGHRVGIKSDSMSWRQLWKEAFPMLKLGFVFMASGFLTMGAAYLIRIIILRRLGFESAGYYQSAWSLGGLYVGFILQAMGADFYPRLTAVSKDNEACNRLVNEQAKISLLLAGPGAIATLTLAPVVIALFYSSKFGHSVEVLRWICLGMTLRVIAWPMGFIIIAKGAQKLFFWTEVAAAVVHVGLAWLLVPRIGVTGAGAAFFGLYVWHGTIVYLIVCRTTSFRWTSSNLRIGGMFLLLTGLVFCSFSFMPYWASTVFGAVTMMASGVYSIRSLLKITGIKKAPKFVRGFLIWCRLADPLRD
jgi:antigen flippase